jgi:hypothetical protein
MPRLPIDAPVASSIAAQSPRTSSVSIQLASFVGHFNNYSQTPFDVPSVVEAA